MAKSLANIARYTSCDMRRGVTTRGLAGGEGSAGVARGGALSDKRLLGMEVSRVGPMRVVLLAACWTDSLSPLAGAASLFEAC